MNYQLLVNNSPVLSGNFLGTAFIALAALAVIAGIAEIVGRRIWAGLRENEVLKYEFVTIIAHKFRTPLTSLKWLIESLLADETDARKKESYTEIAGLSDKLISMTGTLIEMTDTDNEAKSSYVLTATPVCEFVRTAADAYKNQFHEKNLFFSVKCDAPDVAAHIDRPRMEFVLQTLLENALAYTPTGRNVDVTVSARGHKALISVSDTGIGIAPEDLRMIFTKFYRTQNAKEADTEGFGVGLFLARSIVWRHRGRIEVDSPGLGQGSTFTVILPALK